MNIGRTLIVILGPTAVGKSLAAAKVAEALNGEIISADSRQVYRGMDIATAKPAPETLAAVPHHLIDLVNPDAVFSAGQYRQLALIVMDELYLKAKLPVVVGGTGLYIRALLYGLWPGPGAHWQLRRHLVEEESLFGPGHLHRMLTERDPGAASRIHPHDRVKIIRALEVAMLTGVPVTRHHQMHSLRREALPQIDRLVIVGLSREREDLYRRINLRVEEMIQAGLVEETERLLQSGYDPNLPSMRGLGYRQMAGYLQGLYSLQEGIRLIKRDTRRYAKRQMTWFRKEPLTCWIDLYPGDQAEEIADKILERIDREVAHPVPSSSNQ